MLPDLLCSTTPRKSPLHAAAAEDCGAIISVDTASKHYTLGTSHRLRGDIRAVHELPPDRDEPLALVDVVGARDVLGVHPRETGLHALVARGNEPGPGQ